MPSENTVNNIKSQLTDYNILPVNEVDFEKLSRVLDCFDTFKTYNLVVVSEIAELHNKFGKSYLVLLSINNIYNSARSPQVEINEQEYEMIGMTFLKNDYGNVYIRPETIADKIAGLFSHKEIDFDNDTEFSKKYFTLSDDEQKFRKTITLDFLKIIRSFTGMEIEIRGNLLLVRLRKVFNNENGKLIADFLNEFNNGKI